MSKHIAPNVVRGGVAIPLKNKTNYYYMKGRKHNQGGIDIGKNPRTGLEVEDGEVMHVSDNEIKVFSSVPFLNGKSPAQKVLGGENPSKVFKQQESFKDRNGINDDGTKKKAIGGTTSYNSRIYSVTNNGKTNLHLVPFTGEVFKDNTKKYKAGGDIIRDSIGVASNIAGSIASNIINNKMLNKLKFNSQPIARTAAKLKTNININPQLDKMRETLSLYERDVDNNTSSSRVALARKQNARLAGILNTNELYADKENKETALINQDKLNRQAVAAENIKEYNDWSEKKKAFENAVLEKKSENNISLINDSNTAIQDIIGRIEQRNNHNKTITAMALANPNLPIDAYYSEGIINKKTYEAYKKAYGKNKSKDDE